MSIRSRHARPPADVGDVPLTPNALTKQEFGRRLHKMIAERGWNQSELARRADMKKDSISAYINAKRWPTPSSQEQLAKALGVTVDELFPNAILYAAQEEVPAFELKVASGHPGMAWIRINRWMSMDAATRITAIINEEDGRDAGE